MNLHRFVFCACVARGPAAQGRAEKLPKNAGIAKESKLKASNWHLDISNWPNQKPKKSAKNAVSPGHVQFRQKKFCQRLRELGCPDTLIKDVRDVAAAVLCSEGPGEEKRVLSSRRVI
jgi:hypothetical protein